MIVRKLRLQRGWSQDQLAQLSGLSSRTIQRIERGQKAGLESMRALAAVFEVDLTDLQAEPDMNTPLTDSEQDALEYVRDLKAFYMNLALYVLIMAMLLVLNIYISPHYYWVIWPALGWGIGIASHAMAVFEVFSLLGPDWEKQQIEKRLGRKL